MQWYQDITNVEKFSGNARKIFRNLMTKNMDNIVEGKENFQINALIYSMKYHNGAGLTINEMRTNIKNMIAISEKFTRNMDEAAESYRTKSSGENSSKEESPRKNSPERNTSTIETEKLETLEDQDVKTWDVSTEDIIDEDEI